jgi:hypothetical protein
MLTDSVWPPCFQRLADTPFRVLVPIGSNSSPPANVSSGAPPDASLRCSSLLSGSALILFQCDHSLKPSSPQRVWCGVPGPAKKEISEQSWPRKKSQPKFCRNQVKAGNHAKQRSEPWF